MILGLNRTILRRRVRTEPFFVSFEMTERVVRRIARVRLYLLDGMREKNVGVCASALVVGTSQQHENRTHSYSVGMQNM